MRPANGVQLPANDERRRLDARCLVFDMIVQRILKGLQHTNVASLAILFPGDGDEGLGGELAVLPPANELPKPRSFFWRRCGALKNNARCELRVANRQLGNDLTSLRIAEKGGPRKLQRLHPVRQGIGQLRHIKGFFGMATVTGTYVAEAWPEDRRKQGAGYLQTGYYFGFFVAAALNYTIGAWFGWRAMFLCGFVPVIVSIFTLFQVKEPKKWERHHAERGSHPLRAIFETPYLKRTLINAALLAVAVIGLWAGAVYAPTAVITLSKDAGINPDNFARIASLGTAILSIGTIIGCILAPVLAEAVGRKKALAIYYAGMMILIAVTFGWVFYLPNGLIPFLVLLFFLGIAGGNFTMFSLWLPEQYDTTVRASAFAFCTSFGRFIGAGVNFAIAAAVREMGTLGTPIALTAIAFAIGLLLIPFARETKGQPLPE
jgi:MFS family permease